MQSALFTDFYSLAMAQGYWKLGMVRKSVFEMFFRKHPFQGGFSVFAGLDPLLQKLGEFAFSADDIAYLESLKQFESGFLDYLAGFRFRGDVHAVDEGSAVFPQEPLIRVTGSLIECQLVEGLVLNTVNFESLIATKAARVCNATVGSTATVGSSTTGSGATYGSVMEFGLRRAQGADGALSASRASFIGGVRATSNVLAAKTFGIKAVGTMAHSWVMAFPDEEAAFTAFAEIYPNHPYFLIDTFDTLGSGLVNALKVGKRIVEKGGNFGVRLDSGDLYYLTLQVRKALDDAGLGKATIAVSNDLDESIIEALVKEGAPVDSWGVGTRLVSGGTDAAFSGVYKLAAFETEAGEMKSAIKFSDNPEKTTNPAVKQVYRIYDEKGAAFDALAIDPSMGSVDEIREGAAYQFWHPSADYRSFRVGITRPPVPLLSLKMGKGKILSAPKSLSDIQKHARESLAEFDDTHKRLLNPHIYKVSITGALRDLKFGFIKQHLKEH
jgi:nicotinate phosphoribosyltransferase